MISNAPQAPPLFCCCSSTGWCSRIDSSNLMYLMAIRRISFLLSRLSGGCVGTNRRRFTKARLTFCWRHFSRLFVFGDLLPEVVWQPSRLLLLRIPSLRLALELLGVKSKSLSTTSGMSLLELYATNRLILAASRLLFCAGLMLDYCGGQIVILMK